MALLPDRLGRGWHRLGSVARSGPKQLRYLNNQIEAGHGKLKRLIKPTLGFQSMKTAYGTIKSFKVMRALKKGQGALFRYLPDGAGKMSLVHRGFSLT